ncbi:MAG TPA: hypothetical protein DCZ38_03125 [Coxiellaceae bacterium]|nr:MAG: hypothetical protein A2V89_02170 [Gammaproteobacteria bacterium RBG_16_37_9]HBC71754.1 hypothetical protein [Coxiellaceae bacterium]
MKEIVDVLVNWVGKQGRLPMGLKYSTVSKFKEDDWDKAAWSVVLDFDEAPAKQRNPSKAKARFLADNAPHDRLKSGEFFDLYEGKEKIAVVKIL